MSFGLKQFWQLAGEPLRAYDIFPLSFILWPVTPTESRVLSWLLAMGVPPGSYSERLCAVGLVVPCFPKLWRSCKIWTNADLLLSSPHVPTACLHCVRVMAWAWLYFMATKTRYSSVIVRLCLPLEKTWVGHIVPNFGFTPCHWHHFSCSLAQNIAVISNMYL